jgi:NifB/MoaA-like Fe-S oxidoreductase
MQNTQYINAQLAHVAQCTHNTTLYYAQGHKAHVIAALAQIGFKESNANSAEDCYNGTIVCYLQQCADVASATQQHNARLSK